MKKTRIFYALVLVQAIFSVQAADYSQLFDDDRKKFAHFENKSCHPIKCVVKARISGICNPGEIKIFETDKGFFYVGPDGKPYRKFKFNNSDHPTKFGVNKLPYAEQCSLTLKPSEHVDIELGQFSYFLGIADFQELVDSVYRPSNNLISFYNNDKGLVVFFGDEAEKQDCDENLYSRYFEIDSSDNRRKYFLEKGILNPNVKHFLSSVLYSSPQKISQKVIQLFERSKQLYKTPSHLRTPSSIPKISHKLWITGSGDQAADMPEQIYEPYEQFLNDFSDWTHILWVMNKNELPDRMRSIHEKYQNVSIREIDELPFFRGNQVFKYFYNNSYYCFASNIARFNVLYEYGGLYTDIGWRVEKEAKHLFDMYDYVFLPNYDGYFLDVWCGGVKKYDKGLYKYLEYISSLFKISVFADQNLSMLTAASLVCVLPFTSYIFNEMQEDSRLFLSPDNETCFQKNRLNSWFKNVKFGNKSRLELPSKENLPETFFPVDKRIGHIGFFGKNNFGDELFSDVVRMKTDHHLEKIDFNLLLPSNKQLFVEKLLSKFTSFVIGGGDLLDIEIPYNIYFPWELIKDKKIIVLGVGVTNQNKATAESKEKLKRILNRVNIEKVVVRDQESYRVLHAIGVDSEKLKYYPDLVFSLNIPYKLPSKRRVIGFIPRNIDERGYSFGVNDLEYVRETLISKLITMGMDVRIISLREIITERKPIEDLFLKKHPEITFNPYTTPDKTTADIQACDAILTMRYHGAIVAAMSGIPMIAIDVSDKFKGLPKIFDRPDVLKSINSPDLLDSIMSISPVSEETIKKLRSQSQEQLIILDREINL